MAPTSSTIASVRRKSLSADGTRDPNRASTPSANAMSVAIGMPHPCPPTPPPATASVEHRGQHHAADCGEHWQRRDAPVGELAMHDLALDLEADHEEEQRHQPVVDEVPEILFDLEHPEAEVHLAVPERLVAVAATGSSPTPTRRRRRQRARSRRTPRCARSGPPPPAGCAPASLGAPRASQRPSGPDRTMPTASPRAQRQEIRTRLLSAEVGASASAVVIVRSSSAPSQWQQRAD